MAEAALQMTGSSLALLSLFVGGLLLALRFERARRGRMDCYWRRPCQGAAWRRRFPDSPSNEIRAFLTRFTDAFAFRRARRLQFSPDDKVLDVYRTLYPPGGPWVDCLELETLIGALHRSRRIEVTPVWREEVTLGELFTLGLPRRS